MAAARQTPGIDFTEVRFRIESVRAGVRFMLVICSAGWGYAAATWPQPNRYLIAALFGVAAVLALGVMLSTGERLVRSIWYEPLLLAWTATSVGLAAGVSIADGGSVSPLALLFFIPLIFAALSFRPTAVVLLSLLNFAAYFTVNLVGAQPNPESVGFFAVCLAAVAVICAWHARNQEARRNDLAHVSRADPLTGCLNRRGLDERLDAALAQASSAAQPMGLIMLDLDHLKQVNDTRGHAAGDEQLRWAVGQMEGVVRRSMDAVGRVESDSSAVGRIGGDEFAILLPGASPHDTAQVADRVQVALAARAPASLGVACFPADGADSGELLSHADDQLYARKRWRSAPAGPNGRELGWATALAGAVDERMAVRHEHSRQVADYSVAIAERLGWAGDDLEAIEMAGMLHDIGKVSVPDRVLRKRDPLTEEDWAQIRQHPVVAAEMLARIDGLERIVPWIRHSHERPDGAGYPDRLSGEAIPPASRIICVASAFDAMTSDRLYGSALSVEEALEELRANAGTQFDAECVAAFVELQSPLVQAA